MTTGSRDAQLELMWRARRSDADLGDAIGASARTARRRRSELGLVPYRRRSWSDDEDERITAAAVRGATSAESARELDDRTSSQVRARLAKLRRTQAPKRGRFVLVSCSKTKLRTSTPVRASDLYTSRVFRRSLEYARELAPDWRIKILSAGYGLLSLNSEVLTYETTLAGLGARRRRAWASKVAAQIAELSASDLVVLAGQAYIAGWRRKVPMEIIEPLTGLGNGPRFVRLGELIKEERSK